MDLLTVMATLGLLFSAACAFVFLRRSNSSPSNNNNKQKQYAPAIGTILHQIVNIPRIYDYHTELSRKHKTFRFSSPFCQYIYTADPIVVEYFLKTNFQNYGKGWLHYENLKDMFGDGIFSVDGDEWRRQRKLASYVFATKALRDFSSPIFRKNASKLAHVVSSCAKSNEKFDVQDLLMKSTMDSIFRIGFGVELNCLDSSDQEGNEFAKSFDVANEMLILRYVNPLWKVMRYLNIGSEAKLKDKINLVDEYVHRLISIRIEQPSETGNKSNVNEDILSRFLDERKKDPQSISLQFLRDIMLNFVLAGKDSTAGTLAWFFFLICKNPSVQEKIHKEVMEVTEATEPAVAFDAFAGKISEDSLNKMHYLHAALTETLRLYPPGPMDGKVCFSDDTLPGGYTVRKDDVVFYQPYPMGRMEYLWGADAEAFCPERWLNDDGIFQPESPYKFTAFQAGPRLCLGKEFAYRQMKIFTAVLLRFFEFKLSDEGKVARFKTSMTLLIDGGLFLEVCRR
ncbi:cytochrome P450 704C1-like isoform X1 [Zingiber officinale]|uniref:cytochrome P450 704C1-like isoform X1 n=1 Tax=Zingiber officinale TaxID=94328 RepID=UPI001C4B6BFB|nr:cytochrome P450 704C1-like isoform X1 [Zingiber officinale]